MGCSRRPSLQDLFLDWVQVVRKVGKIPGQTDYRRYSQFSVNPLKRRFGRWGHVPGAMKTYILDNKIIGDHHDILEIIENHRPPREDAQRPAWAPKRWRDRPIYGAPMVRGPLTYEPVNEAGVMVLFGALANDLGFFVKRVQTEFPDCYATCEVEQGKCQDVRIEFEFASRNFREHLHDPKGCDMIVCWEHNWAKCPLPVVELKSEVRRLMSEKTALRY
jgi:hypothetical protein